MSYLFLLNRFEIWLLLGIVVALLIFAFQPVEEPASEEGSLPGDEIAVTLDSGTTGESSEDIAEAPEVLMVEDVKIESTQQGQVIELTLLARTSSEMAVEVSEETLKASTETGVPVPHFFAPFREKQLVKPGEPSLVTVKLWLADAAESIFVDFEGERARAELPRES